MPCPIRFGTAAEDDHFRALGRPRLAGRRAVERRLVGRIHIGGRRSEFGRAGVDPLVDGLDAERGARRGDLLFRDIGERAEPRIREARGLQRAQIAGVGGQAEAAHLVFERDDVGDLIEEPRIDPRDLVDLGDAHAVAQDLRDLQQPVRRRLADRRAHRVGVVGLAEALDLDLVEPGEARLERPQRLLQRFGERPPDRHRLADRFHRRRQRRIGAREFFEREARDLGDDIVDRRLERGGRRAAGDVVGDFVERVADREPRRDLGDRKARRLRGERGGARDARIHFDHDHAPVDGIDRELHVRAAGLDADLAQHAKRGVAHDLIFLVGQRQRRRDGDGIAGVHAHRIDVLDRADDDAIVRLVADDLHLEFLPAEHALLDEHLVGWRGVDAALDDLDEFVAVVGDAAAGAAHREARADDRGQADVLERGERLAQRLDVMRARRLQADLGHRLAEQFAILGLVDRLGGRADHLDVILLQHAHFLQAERAVERGLPAHGRQQREAAGDRIALLGDDLGDDLRRDRLDIGPVRRLRIGHDRGGVGIDEDDSIALRAQRLARLRARIVELAGLADDDRARADDEDRRDVGAFRHGFPGAGPAKAAAVGSIARTRKGRSASRLAASRPRRREFGRASARPYRPPGGADGGPT